MMATVGEASIVIIIGTGTLDAAVLELDAIAFPWLSYAMAVRLKTPVTWGVHEKE